MSEKRKTQAISTIRKALADVTGTLDESLGNHHNLTTGVAITEHDLPNLFWATADKLHVHNVTPDDYLKHLEKTGGTMTIASIADYMS